MESIQFVELKEAGELEGVHGELDEQTRKEEKEEVEAALESAVRGERIIIGAKFNAEIVGYVQLVFKSSSRWADGRERALLRDLMVRPSFRGRGIGAVLIREGEKRARARGLRELTLVVRKSNERARKLYERLGYQQFLEQKGDEEGEMVIGMRKEI